MVSGATFAAIPQRRITRIEWFQVLVRTDDLYFTMNLKTLKTVEYFLLEMILKNIFEKFWPRKSWFSLMISSFSTFSTQSTHLVNNLLYDFLSTKNFRKYFSKSSPAKSTRRFSIFFYSYEGRDRQFSRAPGIIQFDWFIAEVRSKHYACHHWTCFYLIKKIQNYINRAPSPKSSPKSKNTPVKKYPLVFDIWKQGGYFYSE